MRYHRTASLLLLRVGNQVRHLGELSTVTPEPPIAYWHGILAVGLSHLTQAWRWFRLTVQLASYLLKRSSTAPRHRLARETNRTEIDVGWGFFRLTRSSRKDYR